MSHTIKKSVNFDTIAKVPMPGDNVAIASCRLSSFDDMKDKNVYAYMKMPINIQLLPFRV